MRKAIAVAAVVAAVVGTGAMEDSSARAESPQPAHVARWMTTPCHVEDASDCYWDAGTMGDGRGHSFYAICESGRRTVVVYWQPRYQRRHGHVVPGCNR